MSNQAHETEALEFLDTHRDESLERLFALLRVRSISTDPEYAEYCREAAQMLVDELADLEFSARVIDTDGHPMVVAHHAGPGPHVLFYGHYDVQPVDPVALWRHDPFDPIVDERERDSDCLQREARFEGCHRHVTGCATTLCVDGAAA